MSRIIFVGVHNKPGMKPLDSRSPIGRIIDRIIARLPAYSCIKTNLFAVDYAPLSDEEMQALKYEWLQRVDPMPEDIVVFLGSVVHKEAPNFQCRKKIKAAHPGYVKFGEIGSYIDSIIEQIEARTEAS